MRPESSRRGDVRHRRDARGQATAGGIPIVTDPINLRSRSRFGGHTLFNANKLKPRRPLLGLSCLALAEIDDASQE